MKRAVSALHWVVQTGQNSTCCTSSVHAFKSNAVNMELPSLQGGFTVPLTDSKIRNYNYSDLDSAPIH